MIEQKITEIVAKGYCMKEDETVQAILALIEQEQQPMRAMAGLLKDSAEHLRWAYRESPIPEDVQATLDEIDAVLGGSHE